MRKISFFAIFMAILFLLISYFAYSHFLRNAIRFSPKIENPKMKEVIIGWIGPLSGPLKFLGEDNLKAMKLALLQYKLSKEKNDPEIKFIIADDRYDPKQTKLEYRKMVDTFHPSLIFITGYSATKAVAEYLLNDSVLILNPIDNDASLANINRNIFLIGKETEDLAVIETDSIISQGKQHPALIYKEDDEFMTILANAFKKILQHAGKEISVYGYKEGTRDFSDSLKDAKSKGADAYVFYGYDKIGYAMKQARDMGIKDPFYSVNLLPDPIFQQNSNGAVNGTFFAFFTSLDGNRPLAEEFFRQYKQRFRETPTIEWIAMQSYDAINIVIEAIKNSIDKKGNFVNNLRNELLNTSDYSGVSGFIRIRPNGSSEGIYPSLYILDNGKAIPAENAKQVSSDVIPARS